jgi:3' terminal RNA ribose 2'-O-methyltransferase Hen1
MLLTITCTATEATDLGYLLHKNPGVLYEKALSFGIARVFYPEATPELCTMALQVEVDPVGLVRGKGASAPTLAQYVSDRPYAPSSFLSVALAECFGTAMGGRSKERPERVKEKLPLAATLYALDCDGGESLIQKLFEPLGYTVTVDQSAPLLDDRFPEWGAGDLYTVTLCSVLSLVDLLTHLYVLIPVLDNAKHYAFGDDEMEKLIKRGEGWLSAHPEKELIARRYLRYRKTLANEALARLADVEGVTDAEEALLILEMGEGEIAPPSSAVRAAQGEASLEKPARLNDHRIAAVLEAIRTIPGNPARRVIDLGCGEGKTLAALLKDPLRLEHVAGMDVSTVALQRAARNLHVERMSEREQARLSLFQGSLVYRDSRVAGFDAALLQEVNSTKPAHATTNHGRYDVALLQEVLEHIDRDRLPQVERNVFGFIRPRRLIITTPNADYNSVWETLPGGAFRHTDHRFEWTQAQFMEWGANMAARYSYTVTFSGIGDVDLKGRGTATQMAVFDVLAD